MKSISRKNKVAALSLLLSSLLSACATSGQEITTSENNTGIFETFSTGEAMLSNEDLSLSADTVALSENTIETASVSDNSPETTAITAENNICDTTLPNEDNEPSRYIEAIEAEIASVYENIPFTFPAHVGTEEKNLISSLVNSALNNASAEELNRILAAIGEYSERDMLVWEKILEYRKEVIEENYLNLYDGLSEELPLPSDLPRNSNLCIVVMGFELGSDGSVQRPLAERLELALLCAEAYPNAFILTTGGHTASANPAASEGGAMRDWLLEKGIAPERLITEENSTMTYDNAAFSLKLVCEQYPEITDLLVITHDYHMPVSALLFQAQALLYTYDCPGREPLQVTANLCIHGEVTEYFSPAEIARQLLRLDY